MDKFGDIIKFSKPTRKNEPLMFFPSNLSAEDITARVRSIDIIKEAALILREKLNTTSFGLENKYCDTNDLKDVWEDGKMKENIESFLTTLLRRIVLEEPDSKERRIDLESLVLDSDDDSDDETDESDDNKVTKNVRAYSLFQTLVYTITPLHAMTGQVVYSRCRSRGLIKTLNKIYGSVSYNEMRKHRGLLASYSIEKCKVNLTPIPSHFSICHNAGFTS